ncbi:4-phosphoerythronate dehydrogenase [Gallaecimonas kandeliae]|uniref:4-phosphoerythronate dehydrogenase n=1 Tax=Gallaecimonas kandeliae TaxID=3029055 RepID=UPI0026487D6F|nr:4-phosphoerythronate dehydrogenase [Gallaecimonas kandeliae]WKE64164.1 4-phosphoerythronate dehydrogenase [Gallaecimonas kandeliae]
MPQILADGLMPLVDELFSELGPIARFEGRIPSDEQLAEAEVLLVRSVTKVDATLLDKTPKLRFVGSATIGTEHLDTALLEQKGIHWCAAPGCNADAVADYVLSAVLNWAFLRGKELSGLSVGIVGVGNIGSRLSRRLNALGVKVLCCDPPRGEPDFISLEALLPQVDVLTLHVPGGEGTRKMLREAQLAALKAGTLLINSCRGSVVDNAALVAWLEAGRGEAVLDVYEAEPDFDRRLLALALWLTPHIAGHSLEGKRRGSWMLYEQLCAQLERPVAGNFKAQLPAPSVARVTAARPDPRKLGNLIYDIRDDDAWFRAGLASGQTFDALRRSYPMRREWASVEIETQDERCKAWGFGAN